jgi:hypothetical protein
MSDTNLVIEIISATVTTVPTAKGSYQVCDLAYKNKTYQNKVEGKKLMSFAEKEAFDRLSKASLGDTFSIVRGKDDKGYWKWNSVTTGANTHPMSTYDQKQQAQVSPKSTYETSEERALRQISIVKQSSIANALKLHELNGVKKNTTEEILATAQAFVNYVTGNDLISTEKDVIKVSSDFPDDDLEGI